MEELALSSLLSFVTLTLDTEFDLDLLVGESTFLDALDNWKKLINSILQ